MFTVLGFYKLKKLKVNKKKQAIFFKNYSLDNNIKGILIISNEGLNGTISGKYKNISSNKLKKSKVYLIL